LIVSDMSQDRVHLYVRHVSYWLYTWFVSLSLRISLQQRGGNLLITKYSLM